MSRPAQPAREIRCPRGLAGNAIHLWSGSAGTLVDRNLLVDAARG